MSEKNPAVSILMTAYNREKYIAAAIESVLASDFKDFELIITDDRSTDATVKIAESYAKKDSRIRVFVNRENLGDYPNRNKAASYAKGKYLKYIDADDYIYPWGLGLLIDMMEQFPDAGWGLCSLDQDISKPFPFQLSPAEAYSYHYIGPGLFHKAPLSAIIKRDVFKKIDGFSAIRMAGDFEMWNHLAQKFPVVLMPHGLVWYRVHQEQEMKSYSEFVNVYEQVKIKYLLDACCPLERSIKKSVIINNKKKLIKELLKGILTINRNRITENIKALKVYFDFKL